MKQLLLSVLLACTWWAANLQAQEVRVQGNILILGYVDDPFVGVGLGLENPMGKHLALSLDVNWGKQDLARSIEFRPALHYYPGRNQTGFFAGPSLKYISLKESDENIDRWDDHLYAPGIDLGVKSDFSGFGSLGLILNPHVTVGGTNESGVAGMSAQVFFGVYF